MAAKLAASLPLLAGVHLCHPVEANEIFIQLPEAVIEGLVADGPVLPLGRRAFDNFAVGNCFQHQGRRCLL